MKYVMLEVACGPRLKRKVPLIFPDALVHADVAAAVTLLCEGMDDAKPVSAGFVRVGALGYECFGDSETLKLKAHPDDATVINTYDYTHGLI